MKILYVIPKNTPISEKRDAMLLEHGVKTLYHSPTLFSAFASLKLAKVSDAEDVDIIVVRSLKDAMSALSAKKISSKGRFRIVYEVESNTAAPLSIPGDIRNGVDGWMFKNAAQMSDYPVGLRNTIVIPPTSYLQPVTTLDNIDPSKKIIISWVGDITQPDNLKKAIEEVEKLEGSFDLRIAGAGRAARVMPVVRLSRAVQYSDNITWVGENYDITTEISQADALVATDRDLTEIEVMAMQSGRRVINPDKIEQFVASPTPLSAEDARAYDPRTVVPQLVRYLNDIRALTV